MVIRSQSEGKRIVSMTLACAPELITDRLILRAHRRTDFDASAALWADPAVVRYISGRPSTPEESWQRLLRYAGLWPLLGFGYWVIADKASGAFLGEAGLADFRRVMTPSLNGMPEAGWVLTPAAQGQGFAREAVLAILAWADRHLAAAQTACIIDPTHAASHRLAHAVGYVAQGECAYRDGFVSVYKRQGIGEPRAVRSP